MAQMPTREALFALGGSRQHMVNEKGAGFDPPPISSNQKPAQ
jgi:hypothetical protein